MYNPKRRRGLSPKLQQNWERPYTVFKKLNDVVYKVQRSPNAKPKVIHINRLAPYRATDHSSKFKKTNIVENKQRSKSPRTFSEREERWIVRQVHINPRTSAVKLTLKCKSRFRKSVNPETVTNVLRKLKYHGRVPRRKPYINKANRKARLAFAQIKVKQPTEFWENVILVDESKYNNFGSDGKQKVWRTPNAALHVIRVYADSQLETTFKPVEAHNVHKKRSGRLQLLIRSAKQGRLMETFRQNEKKSATES
ncbi:hypothetical protein AVEN_18607-1 [Araneus ventricosus]|uniref:Uncharacterized protein n=1 Tax=Araneus ventricosus TaxID=182803 RepID=A0A4Y2FPN1_ARAVE|nr:hypothetical protein AVEN_18607-1 [Araneus ventricosus]